MQSTFRVSNSTLSTEELALQVVPFFGVGPALRCDFFSFGINDTYRVTTRDDKVYFMRVYRHGLRSRTDVNYELAMLNHLHKKGVSVARPLPSRSGSYTLDLPAPEGTRFAALFTLAEGVEPVYDSHPEQVAEQYGQAVARLHNALDDFACQPVRLGPDLERLIDGPMRSVRPFLEPMQAYWDYVEHFASRLRERIVNLPIQRLEQGACHGDLQGFHAHIDAAGTLTFYDFDFCGYGYRAYDLAVFRWCARLKDQESIWWPPYLRGYTAERNISDLDLQAVPLFVCARHIWHMGLHTANAHTWGCGDLNEAYFSQRIQWLQSLEADYLA